MKGTQGMRCFDPQRSTQLATHGLPKPGLDHRPALEYDSNRHVLKNNALIRKNGSKQ